MLRVTAVVLALVVPLSAWADCRVVNTTDQTFTFDSGRTRGQRVIAYGTKRIDAGNFSYIGNKGSAGGGFCPEGGSLRIVRIRTPSGFIYVVR